MLKRIKNVIKAEKYNEYFIKAKTGNKSYFLNVFFRYTNFIKNGDNIQLNKIFKITKNIESFTNKQQKVAVFNNIIIKTLIVLINLNASIKLFSEK